MGLDPGIERLGYAILDCQGSRIQPVSYGLISTSARDKKETRFVQIWEDVNTLITKYQPQVLSIESIIFAKNVKTALVISEVRGILLLAGTLQGITVHEFTPLQVKTQLTGYGRADKSQMQHAIKMILGLKEVPKPDDVADALAIALCGAYENLSVQS